MQKPYLDINIPRLYTQNKKKFLTKCNLFNYIYIPT